MKFASYEIINCFEETIAEYAGAKFGVAVESCTAALFLCCVYHEVPTVVIPKFTYPGVPSAIIKAGGKVQFSDINWSGAYALRPYGIWDSAMRFKKGMYAENSFWCLSFQNRKHLPIGRGGMILCNDKKAVKWFKQARFDGRDYSPQGERPIKMLGWNMYMTPEQAARGLMLFERVKDLDLPDLNNEHQHYPDLSKVRAYQ